MRRNSRNSLARIEVAGHLLASEDPHELAVGIITATVRRPHEVIALYNDTLATGDEPPSPY